MRMPFKHEEPQGRLQRLRCAARERASGARQSMSGAAGTVSGAAGTAATTGRQAAVTVSGAAQTAAHQMADAASSMAERARPVATEAATRGAAAWDILRHGAPPPTALGRIAAAMPVATMGVAAGKAATKAKAPFALMVVGATGAVGYLFWRRSRMNNDTVWILDEPEDSDLAAPPGGWPEGSERSDRGARSERSHRSERSGRSGRSDRSGKPSGPMGADDSEPMASADHKDAHANRWP